MLPDEAAHLQPEVDDLMRRIEAAVRTAVDSIDQEIAAVCLGTEDEEDRVWPPGYWAATTQDRDQALSVDEGERFEHAWMFPSYSIDRDIDLSSRQDGDEALVAALWRIAAIDDPVEWILQDVCRNISHAPPANARTPDSCASSTTPGSARISPARSDTPHHPRLQRRSPVRRYSIHERGREHSPGHRTGSGERGIRTLGTR
jgi:hypothetical protein